MFEFISVIGKLRGKLVNCLVCYVIEANLGRGSVLIINGREMRA